MQYSLRTLLLVMLLVCFLSASFAFPFFLQRFVFGLLFLVMTVTAGTVAVYGRGRLQVFGLGVTLGLVSLTLQGLHLNSLFEFIYGVILLGLCGVIAVGTKWFLVEGDLTSAWSLVKNSARKISQGPDDKDHE